MNNSDDMYLWTQLREREKELDALYKLATLYTEPELTSECILNKTAEILKESMQHPGKADVHIGISPIDVSPDKTKEVNGTFEAPSPSDCIVSAVFGTGSSVRISITYQGEANSGSPLFIMERERHLAESTASLLANVLQKKELENILRESALKLRQQTADLEHKNIALKEVLSQIETEKREYLTDTKTFIDSIIFPEINKLTQNKKLSEHEKDILLNLRTSLEIKFGKDIKSMMKFQQLLTPRELEICSLIRNGMSTKEIAVHLNISDLTVERHRNTIRRKLNLNNRKINLTTFLRSPL